MVGTLTAFGASQSRAKVRQLGDSQGVMDLVCMTVYIAQFLVQFDFFTV